MILFIYRMLTPFAVLVLPIAAVFSAKLRRGLALRARRTERPNFSKPPIWIHVASGEFEYAKPVITELKLIAPDVPVVVTFFSPTYATQVRNHPGVDHAEPLPLDLPGPTADFLDHVRPRLCVIARTDFWPEILMQTARRKIPRIVFAYTQRPVHGLKAMFSRAQLTLLDEVLVVGPQDRIETMRLAPGALVQITGDPRFDQVAARLSDPRPLPPALKPDGPTLVAGSTWAADEAVLLPALAPLLRAHRLRLILVPHEPTPKHLARIRTRLRHLGLTHADYSAAREWSDKHVLLVDRTGVLAELYAWGDFAFIGGSFKSRVHSVMEALGTGAITFTGPKIANNREAIDFAGLDLRGQPGLRVVTTVEHFTAQVSACLDRDVSDQRAAIRAAFEARRGAARAIARRLADA